MTEIEKLRAQKKEIEERIKALQEKTIEVGRARLSRDMFPTIRNDEYVVSLLVKSANVGVRGKWRAIIRDTDKNMILESINEIVADLNDLQEQILHEEKRD